MSGWIGFASGVGVSVVGAIVASLLAWYREREKKLEDRRFRIYMKFLDVYGDYYWFTVAELHKEEVNPAIRERCRSRTWEIADLLRESDDVGHLEELLDILLGEGFESTASRFKKMSDVADELGKRVNPRYQKKIREISKANMERIASGAKLNAPGANR